MMKISMFIFLIATLAGCANQTEVLRPDVLPRLKDYSTIFYPGSDLSRREVTVQALLLINERGDVARMELPKSTGSIELDDSIRSSALRWKYSPAEYQGKQISIWISQRITIQFQSLMTYILSEIVVPRADLADSLARQLREGKDFDLLAKEYSVAESRDNGGFVGKVVVNDLKPDVWKAICKLSPGEWTSPVPVERNFAIYKRMK
jgi:TonB family protein